MAGDWELIEASARGDRGEDQRRIAEVGLAWLATLLRKNADYGSSVWRPPVLCPDMQPGDSILVRASDKVKRIAQLRQKEAEVTDESLRDTVTDLGAYCLLWLARPDIEEPA